MMDFRNSNKLAQVVGSTTARQILSGIVSLLALGLAARNISSESFAAFSMNMILAALVASVAGMPIYPAVYRALTQNTSLKSSVKFILITAPFSLAAILVFFLVIYSGTAHLWETASLSSVMLLSAIPPALSLGVSDYRSYNRAELLPPVVAALAIFLSSPDSSSALTICFILGHLSKIVFYAAWIHRNTSSSACAHEKLEMPRNSISEGFKIGSTGTLNSALVRTSFLAVASALPPPLSVLFLASLPFVEKLLILPQSMNAILYGAIRRKHDPRHMLNVYTAGCAFLLLIALSLVGFCIVYEKTLLPESFKGFGAISLLAVGVCFAQSMRILASSVVSAMEKSSLSLADGLIALASVYLVTLIDNHMPWQLAYISIVFIICLSSLHLGARAVASYREKHPQ